MKMQRDRVTKLEILKKKIVIILSDLFISKFSSFHYFSNNKFLIKISRYIFFFKLYIYIYS